MKSFCLIALLVLVSISSCRFRGKRIKGNGNIATEERNVGQFSGIKLRSGMDVIIDSGAASVKVEADENVLPYILTKVDGDNLVVRYHNNISLTTSNGVKVYITAPSLSGIDVTGSGNVSAKTKLRSPGTMSFRITGSGGIDLSMNSPKVNANITGSGNLNLSGETREVDIDISGSGNYLGKTLKAETADISIMGSGDAETFADVRLKAKITGSGNIRYSGNAVVDKTIHGSGRIEKF